MSRDFKACINGDTALNANFTLNPTGDSLQVANLTSQPVTLRATIDQAGDNAGTSNLTQQLNAGQNTVIQASTSPYLSAADCEVSHLLDLQGF